MATNPLFIASSMFVVSDSQISSDLALLPGTPGPKRTAQVTFQKPGGAFRVVQLSTHLTVDMVITVLLRLFDISDYRSAWVGAGAFGPKPIAIGDTRHIPADTLFFDAQGVRFDRLGADFTVNVDGETFIGIVTGMGDYTTDMQLLEGRGARFDAESIARSLELLTVMTQLTADEQTLFRMHSPFGEVLAWLVQEIRDNGPIELTRAGAFEKDFLTRAVQESVVLGYVDRTSETPGDNAMAPLTEARDLAVTQGLIEDKGNELHATIKADQMGSSSKAVAAATVVVVKTLGETRPEWYEALYTG